MTLREYLIGGGTSISHPSVERRFIAVETKESHLHPNIKPRGVVWPAALRHSIRPL